MESLGKNSVKTKNQLSLKKFQIERKNYFLSIPIFNLGWNFDQIKLGKPQASYFWKKTVALHLLYEHV